MTDRETLTRELNELNARAEELAANDAPTDELVRVTSQIQARTAQLAAHDAQTGFRSTVDLDGRAIGGRKAKSLARRLIEAGIVERAKQSEFGGVQVEDRAGDTFIGDDGSTLGQPDYDPDIATLPRKPLELIDEFAVRPATNSSVRYHRLKSRELNAGAVPKREDGDYKKLPRSAFEWERVTRELAIVGHTARTDKDSIEDEGELESIIVDEGQFGVRQAINAYLATLPAVKGYEKQVESLAYGAGEDTIDLTDASGDQEKVRKQLEAVARGALAVRLRNYASRAVVISPTTATNWQLLKDNEDRYVASSPFGGEQIGNGGTVFGHRVIVEHELEETGEDSAPDTILVGGWDGKSLRVQYGIETSMTESNADDFEDAAAPITLRFRQKVQMVNKHPESLQVVKFSA